MENSRRIALPKQGHVDIILESVNAVEEENDWRPSQNGRMRCDAQWQDSDDVHVLLSAYRAIDPSTSHKPESMQKPWMFYYLLRRSSMPDFAAQKFHYTTRANEDKVWLCDAEGKAIRSQSHQENIEYMNIVINALRQRPTRRETGGTVRLFALENIMASDNVKNLIARLDDGTKNSIGIDLILDFIIQNEPILSGDRDMIESYIKDLHAWRISDDPASDPV